MRIYLKMAVTAALAGTLLGVPCAGADQVPPETPKQTETPKQAETPKKAVQAETPKQVETPKKAEQAETPEEADFQVSMERVAVQALARKGAWEELFARSSAALAAHPGDPVFQRARIRALRLLGYNAAARKGLQAARAVHPQDPGLLLEELWLAVNLRDWGKMLAQSAPGAARPDADPELLLLRAVALRETGDHGAALALFTRLLQADPKDCAALTNRGRLLAKAGKEEQALADLTLAKTCSGRPEPLLARGQLLMKIGRHAEAEQDLTAALAVAPDDLAALLARSEARLALGQVAAAAQDLEVARKISAADPRIQPLYCRIALAAGDGAALAACAEELARLTPKDPAVWRNLARARLQAGDVAGAVAAYDSLVQLSGDDPKPRLERATVQLLRRDYPAALADCSAVLERQPVALAYALRAMAHYRSGGLAQAEEDCTNALALDRNEPNAMLVRANLALGRNDLPQALADCERAVRRSPNSPWGAVTCGRVQLQGGNLEQAVFHAERAKALAPADPETQELLALVAARKAAPGQAAAKPDAAGNSRGKGEAP